MKKKRHAFEPHLVVNEFHVLPGVEWLPKFSGWSLIQIRNGFGYCLSGQGMTELPTGSAVLTVGKSKGSLRASQLGPMSLRGFHVIPSRLTGLITLGEQELLKNAARRRASAFQIFPPNSSLAIKLGELLGNQKPGRLLFRLNLFQLFIEAVDGELSGDEPSPETNDARERLQDFLKRTPPGELAEMSFSDLAGKTRCTTRHLSRVFRELVGMSFRDKRAEIRMARARELLATSKSKVLEVALESGFKSLSLFNHMFTRRFGTSPSRWRRQQANLTSPREDHYGNGNLLPLQIKLQLQRS